MYKSSIFTESLLPIIFSLIGLIFAGEILDLIQNWQLFLSDPELFILVPILLGLKGNLETCLSARLCTCANLGQLDSNNKKDDLSIYKIFTNCIASVSGSSTSQRWDILFGNFAVTQVQSLTIGFVAGIWSCILGSTGSLDKLALVACIGSICASISSGILSVFMSWAIITCKQRGLDPDNIAIPIAASLGDLLIVFGLALCGEAYGLVSFLDRYLPTVILFICFIMAYFWLVVVNKNKPLKSALNEGWIPMIASVLLSSLAGVILEENHHDYHSCAMLVPVLNGLTGNVASIYASKLSTGLHLAKSTEALDHKSTLPKYSYSDSKPLVVLSTMASFLFLIVVHLFDIGEIPKGLQFNILYLSVNLLLTVLLIIIAHFITLKSWKYGLDPDNTSLPLLTAIADLIGTILIVGALHSQHD